MSSNAEKLLTERDFMTAGGTETYLLFQQQFPMREFCAFEIYDDEAAVEAMTRHYLDPLVSAVSANGHGLLLDALLWRAHPDYIAALGYESSDLQRFNELAIARTREIIGKLCENRRISGEDFPVLVAADIGPRGDGYRIDTSPSVEDAFEYHRAQLQTLASTSVDVICAWTMTNVNEAIGITKGAAELGTAIIVSPTVETDGRLPDGTPLAEFIKRVDDATDALPVFYMVNCAHPIHLAPALESAGESDSRALARLQGFRANSSKMSHAELDNSTELDRGNPKELASELAEMKQAYGFRVLGGCCGTDVEHINEISRAVA